jgi:ABC-2 type transport system permease protein
MKRMVTRSSLLRYPRIWWQMASMTLTNATSSRLDFVSYVIGKLVRMAFFFLFAISLFIHTPTIAGYDRAEVLLFFAMMSIVDVLVQLIWFRGMMDLAYWIRRGDFDFVLSKPISTLFWTAFHVFDFFDLTTLPAAIAFCWYAFRELGPVLTTSNVMLGVAMLICGLVLAFAVNLLFAAYTFWTTHQENLWWLYRHAAYVSRFPPSIFPQALQWIFTYLFPILIIVVFSTKAFLGELSTMQAVWAGIVVILWLAVAFLVWNRGLRHYTSASS